MYSLAKHSGVSESVLSRLKTNSQAKISKKNIILLANYFCVNEEWLETGEGDRNALGVVRDTLIHDSGLHERFLEIAQDTYGDNSDRDEYWNVINVDVQYMSTYTDIPQERLIDIIYNKHFPSYTEVKQLLKSDKRIDANWLILGVGTMYRTNPLPKETERISTLVDTISTLQDTINKKSEIIAALTERIKQLEDQLNNK